MIRYINGIITEKYDNAIVVESNNMGFYINIANNSPLLLATDNEIVKVYTFMSVKEDDISLFGFADKEELSMFNLLTSISGIGCKGAMNILSKLSVREIKEACLFDDADTIAKANGIGKKTAQRIVLELKDKLSSDDILPVGSTIESTKIQKGSNKEQAIQGLMSLGFSKTEAMQALSSVQNQDLSVEEYIKLALKAKR